MRKLERDYNQRTTRAPGVNGETILLDADLAILGADPDEYARYARAIRQEYAWVPEADYRRGRTTVLQGFLVRARIFRLDRIHERLDAAARRNLRDELAALRT